MFGGNGFNKSVLRQIEIKRARTPTERFLALCDLPDAERALAATNPVARERQARERAARLREKEEWRAEYRRLFAANRADDTPRV